MSDVSFDLSPVEKKPSRRYRKGSKYDPVIDKFLEGNNSLVSVEIKGKDGNYIRTQLKKRSASTPETSPIRLASRWSTTRPTWRSCNPLLR